MVLNPQEMLIKRFGYPTPEERAQHSAAAHGVTNRFGATPAPSRAGSKGGIIDGQTGEADLEAVQQLSSAGAAGSPGDPGGVAKALPGDDNPGTGKGCNENGDGLLDWPWEGTSHPAVYSVIVRGGAAAGWNLRASWAVGKASCTCC